MKNTKRVGIWIRVSTEDQVRGESPETHERRARAYAESRDWAVVELYRLDAISGKTVKELPEAKRMLSDIKSGHITGLIFSKLARLARNTKELLEFAELFRDAGADLISLAEAIDTSTPAGRLFYTMIAAMAQWEREEIASRVAASVPIRAKMGKPLGGQAPFGYHWVDKELRVDPAEAPVRKLMYELFKEHGRKKVVARMLNERGYRTRNGSNFTDTTVDRLLRDPTAKGVRRANYTETKDSKGAWKLKPKKDWILLPVEPIVSEELWEEVNVRIDEMRAKGKRQTKPAVHLFSGLVFCECDNKMYVPTNTIKYTCYKCRNKMPIADLEAIFKEELRAFVFSPDEISDHVQAGNEKLASYESQLAVLEKEKRKLNTEADDLFALYQDRALDKAGFASRYDKIGKRLAQIEAEVPETQAKRDVLRIALVTQEDVLMGTKDLVTRWNDLDSTEKRRIVETIVERVTIGQGEVEFDFLYAPGTPPTSINPPSTPSSSTPTIPGIDSKSAMNAHSRVALLPFIRRNRKGLKNIAILPAPQTLGEHIRAVRLARKHTLAQAGAILGVTLFTVLNWEKGKKPRVAEVPAILRFLGYDPFPVATTLMERMLTYRTKNGLNFEDAARRCGLHWETWRTWEEGRNKKWWPKLKTKIERFLNDSV